jgi:hypothetical protein
MNEQIKFLRLAHRTTRAHAKSMMSAKGFSLPDDWKDQLKVLREKKAEARAAAAKAERATKKE